LSATRNAQPAFRGWGVHRNLSQSRSRARGIGKLEPAAGADAVSRGPLPFRQTDVARAIKGAVAAGLTVQRVEVDKAGKIVVVVGSPAETVPLTTPRNDFGDDA